MFGLDVCVCVWVVRSHSLWNTHTSHIQNPQHPEPVRPPRSGSKDAGVEKSLSCDIHFGLTWTLPPQPCSAISACSLRCPRACGFHARAEHTDPEWRVLHPARRGPLHLPATLRLRLLCVPIPWQRPGLYVEHRELTRGRERRVSANNRRVAHSHLVRLRPPQIPALNGAEAAVSFQSLNFPDHYITVDANGGVEPGRLGIAVPADLSDASFVVSQGPFNASTFTFSSLSKSFPGYVMSTTGHLQGPCGSQYSYPATDIVLQLSAPAANTSFYMIAIPPPPPVAVTIDVSTVTHVVDGMYMGCHSDSGCECSSLSRRSLNRCRLPENSFPLPRPLPLPPSTSTSQMPTKCKASTPR